MKKPYNPKPLPKPVKSDPVHGDEYEHESFGTISARRAQGGSKRPMFGSKILHDANGTVTVEITEADYKRNLNSDWIYPRRTIVEVEMTESQWAAFISSPNSQPVPCTINERWVFEDGKLFLKRMEDPPFFEIIEQFDVEVKERLAKVTHDTREMMKKMDEMLAGKSVPKAELKELRMKLQTVLGYLPGNLDFVAEQFEEAMEKTVEEAKLAVETHIDRVLHTTGLEAVRHMIGLGAPAENTKQPQIEGESTQKK